MTAQRPAAVELLESRMLMSASPAASLGHGVLRVSGAGNAENVIVVQSSADNLSVEVTVHSLSRRGVAKDFSTSFLKSFGIDSIRVWGGAGNDSITVGQALGGQPETALDLDTRVFGLAGDDTIVTAGGSDVIFAGLGNDTVRSHGGRDRVFGDAGNDDITTGAGDDRVHGGIGDDVIDTGAGDDLARGGAGADDLNLGAGNDVGHGQQDNDIVNGGDGDDTIWGGAGDDTEYGGAGNDQLGGLAGRNNLQGGAGQDTFLVFTTDQNPENDYDPTEDILTLLPKKTADGDASTVV